MNGPGMNNDIDTKKLAIAVLKQWVLDGKPQRDLSTVKLWASVLLQQQVHHRKVRLG